MESKLAAPQLLYRESHIRVLRFLWRSRLEWSGREVARKTSLSAPSCHEALKNLHARGFVLFRRVSNVHLYKINEENYLVQRVFGPLFKAEESIPNEVLNLIKRTLTRGSARSRILSLVLFGSRARGQVNLHSDLDLLIIVPDKKGMKAIEPAIDRLRTALARKFNIPLSPYIQTLTEIKSKHAGKLPLRQNILKEGKLLYGKTLKELMT